MRRSAAALVLSFVTGCTSPISTPTASPTSTQSIATSTAAATAASATPTATAEPTRLLGTALVPTLLPAPEFAALSVTLDLPSVTGQPAETRVWRTEPFVADSAYVTRAATTFGMTDPGVVGAAPGGGPAWRLWWGGDAVLAVNIASGELLYFAGGRDDGPRGPGPAQADPAGAFESLLRVLGSGAAFTHQPGYLKVFRGGESTAPLAEIVGGTWTTPGSREAAVMFPRYADPHQHELTIYDTDEVGLFTSRLRPVAIVHRPLGRLLGGEIYPMTTFGDAIEQLRAAPQRYLRLLSGAPDGPLSLAVGAANVVLGYAWAQSSRSDLRRAGRTLVPVWVFPASGVTASGMRIDALFTVDAVVPEMRAPSTSSALNIDADHLLRQQLTQLGGQRPGLRDPQQVAQEFLGAQCGGIELTTVDADRYTGSASCNAQRVTFTVSRAFPGLPESIWFASDLRR